MMNNHTVHPYPTRREVTVHMNAMMSIHISNSNGSHAIIFHIIQTFMLTHQLACINTSFSIHISSHSIKTIIVLSSTHHSCFSCQATTFEQFHMDHFNPTSNPVYFLTVPNLSVGCPWTAPFIKHRFHFFGTEIHSHFWPHNIQNRFMAF